MGFEKIEWPFKLDLYPECEVALIGRKRYFVEFFVLNLLMSHYQVSVHFV